MADQGRNQLWRCAVEEEGAEVLQRFTLDEDGMRS